MLGRKIGFLIGFAWAASASIAHSPYLLPNAFDTSDRDHVSVQASFTEDFFIPDVVMKGDQWHVIGPDGRSRPLTPVYTRDLAVLDVDTPQPGTYRISSGRRDGRVAKATISNGEWKFLREGDAPPSGEKVYETRSITRAEVYVTRGAANDAALTAGNQGLEFQLLTHPARIIAGSAAQLRVVFDGKPLSNGSLTLRRAQADESAAQILTSDAQGLVRLEFATPGLYHAQLRHRIVLPGTEARAESHTYALTLEVGE